MPTRLNARYEVALTDPELTSIRKDVALLQAILDDRLAAWAGQDGHPDASNVLEADWIAEIRSLVDQRARLATQEHRRMVDLDQVLTVEQVVLIATALGSIVGKYVTDAPTKRAISAEFSKVLSTGDRGELIQFPK